MSIIDLYKSKNYRFFSDPYSMNVYGIRSGKRSNKFDDVLGVIYSDGFNTFTREYPCTVDPGIPWLIAPMDPGGTAAIVEGQYRSLWRMGTFKGRRALIQITPIKVYRDNNRNQTFEYGTNMTEGMYGIFLHPSFQGADASEVDRSSAGCIVPRRDVDFEHFMQTLDLQVLAGLGNTFTFTLF